MGPRADALVAAARTGDEAAWRGLYELHARRLVLWLGALPTGDSAMSAEDVAADSWAVAASKIGEFEGSDHEFGGWLVGIARNMVFNYRRRSQRRRTEPSDDPGLDRPAVGLGPEDVVAGSDLTRHLLSRLSAREAEVVACIDVVGLDVAATALALDMSPTAVRVARHRALGRLRRELGAPSMPTAKV